MAAVVIGILLVILSAVFYATQRQQRHKLTCVQLARSVTVQELNTIARAIHQDMAQGNWRDYVKVWGIIQSENPLVSELKQAECVHYSTRVTQDYEERTYRTDPKTGGRLSEDKKGSETLVKQQQSIPFQLRDETGIIQIDPTGAIFDTVEVLDQFQPAQPNAQHISMGPFSLELPPQSGKRQILGYRYQESILPVGRQVLIVGTVTDESSDLVIRQPTKPGQKLIVSLKSDEVYTAAATKAAKNYKRLMIGCGVGGAILIVLGLLW
ncbi:MAG: E3 ubiquitin ligase family protein [Cyanobacteria bacterium P01_G01_bin.38]